MKNPTAALAGFAADLDADSIPEPVAADAKRLLLDAIGSALIGWTSEDTRRVSEAAAAVFGTGRSTVISGEALSPAGATMVNAYLITARSFCDVHRPTLCHVTPVIVPPALAAAERFGASGRDLLAGIVAGMEILLRIGWALRYEEFRSRGWHTPGVVGPIGAAAAAARVARSGPSVIRDAMGLGGAQAGGTFASLGSPAIKFHQARAATAGLLSAELAADGFAAAADILAATDGGLLTTYSDGGDPDLLTAGLGDLFHLHEISTRRWPAAAASQELIAAILGANAHAGDVVGVHVGLPPDSFRMNAAMGWETPFTATLSTRWVAAVTLEDGACWLEQFTPQRLSDKGTGARAEAIDVGLDETLDEGGVDLTLIMADGSERRERRGPDDAAPSDWGATVDKLHQAAAGVLDPGAARTVVEIVASLETHDDIAGLMALLDGGARSSL